MQHVLNVAPRIQHIRDVAPRIQHIRDVAPRIQHVLNVAPRIQRIRDVAPRIQYIRDVAPWRDRSQTENLIPVRLTKTMEDGIYIKINANYCVCKYNKVF